MYFLRFILIWLHNCWFIVFAAEYISNEPTTITSCNSRYIYLDNYASSPVCESLKPRPPPDGAFGKPAQEKEFTHMAAIGWIHRGEQFWDCGGVLITNYFVVTAAHCSFSENYNSSPNLVRIGELGIEDESRYFNVSHIFNHPDYSYSSHYDDIALIKLDRSVVTSDFVLPACLWTSHNFNFEQLDAAGWGLGGFAGNRLTKLHKYTLKVVPNKKCNNFYRRNKMLREGIKDTQLCARDALMDTCEGDSGGPLEIKLIAGERKIPFVVGLTSFGSTCGKNVPGVFTRVSSYIPWISSIVNETFEPNACFIRNFKTREFTYDTDSQYPDFIVTIINENDHTVECGGSVIDRQYVLTLNSCFSKLLHGTKMVIFNDGGKIEVSSSVSHPIKNESHDNFVLVKLAQKIKFHKLEQIVCMPPPDYTYSLRFTNMISTSPALLFSNRTTSELSNLDFNNTQTFQNSISPEAGEECSKQNLEKINITEIDENTQICATNYYFHVPGVCQNLAGGPWFSGDYDYEINEETQFLVGLQSFGADCSSRTPIVASKVTPAIAWINSILFFNQTIEESSSNAAEDLKKCINFGKRKDSHVANFNESSVFIRKFRSKKTSKPQLRCEGILITRKLILTTARCIGSIEIPKMEILDSRLNKVKATQLHIYPEYSPKSGENDIAIIETDPIEFDDFVFPACLWFNTTHLPFKLHKSVIDWLKAPNIIFELELHSFSNQDCSDYFDNKDEIRSSEFCAAIETLKLPSDEDLRQALCLNTCEQHYSDAIYHKYNQNEQISRVVVGLSSAVNSCDWDKPLVYTRVSAYKDWIESFM